MLTLTFRSTYDVDGGGLPASLRLINICNPVLFCFLDNVITTY